MKNDVKMGKLSSPFEIKLAVGNELVNYIKENDPANPKHSRKGTFNKQILHQYGNRCIICDKEKLDIEIQIAHIRPIKEGGITGIDNLVPLCYQKNKLGCHQLYDNGYLSRNKLKEIATQVSSKGLYNSDIRQDMIRASKLPVRETARPPPDNVKVPKVGYTAFLKGRTKSVKKLKPAAKNALENKYFKSEFFIRLRLAEFLRRGRGANALNDGFKEIKRCKELLNEVSEPYHSRFYYEYGYIHHLLGNSREANSAFNCSARIANKTNDDIGKVEEIIALAQGAVVEMLAIPSRGSKAIDKLELIEKRLFDIEEKSRSLKSAIGNRWVTSCIIHQTNVNIKMRRIAKAKELFLKATNFRDSLDATSGWTASSVPSILRTDLLIGVLDENGKSYMDEYHKHLIEMCCRSLRTMLLGNDNRPEGIKDVIIALRWLLEREKNPINEFVNKLSLIEKKVHDSSSGLL